ncbi:MAG: AMP-binding protein, partial [Paracoccaceae bacterium]|nr:AMP-binding protein [Paracoccaceae bacterium]
APSTLSRIVDPETGQDAAPGEVGELWVKGPQVMVGYLNNAKATQATLTPDGWLKTGDIARIDEDGYLFVVDRVKELIKYKGFQVPPAELEALIITHPAVADVAVIGVPDEEAGELPMAWVVTKPGATVTLEEVQAHLSPHIAHYKQICRLGLIDAIPKSASGKILRRLLRSKV